MTFPTNPSRFIPSPLARFGLRVQEIGVSKRGFRHFHIASADKQSSLVLAIPVSLEDDSGVAHVLEHLLLTGSSSPGVDSFFFSVRAESSAVDMNAVTNSQYLAVHFTCENEAEYLALLDCFSAALFQPNWNAGQLEREVGSIDNPGVIANEMAGVFSEKRTRLALRTYAAMFENGSKKFNSGGDPDLIHTVNQSALEAIWSRFFRAENLVTISSGAISAEVVGARLDSAVSSFRGGICEPIGSSIPISAFQQQKKVTAGSGGSSVSVGLLLQKDQSCRSGLEPILLGALLRRHTDQITSAGAGFGLLYDIAPEIRQIDGDYFIFASMPADTVPQHDLIADSLADSIDAVLIAQSSQSLLEICDAALYDYLTLGNHKAGAGVTASMLFLDYFCREDAGSFDQTSYDETFPADAVMVEFSKSPAWCTLVENHIRSNPRLVLFHEQVEGLDQVKERDFAEQGSVVTPSVIQQVDSAGGDEHRKLILNHMALPLTDSESVQPSGIYAIDQATVFHYQLSRPWIATSKVVVPLPSAVTEDMSAAETHCIFSETKSRLAESFPLFDVSVDAMRCRGNAGVLCYATLSASGGEAKTMQALQSFTNNPHHSLCFETSTSSASGDCYSAIKPPLPLHKQAIYRSAENLSRVAAMKLALHGCLNDMRASGTDTVTGIDISLRPARIFLCTATPLPAAFSEVEMSPNQVSSIQPKMQKSLKKTAATTGYSTMPTSGSVHHCARVWQLAADFGQSPQDDAVAYLFAALVTSLYLEPVLRGQRYAYAASADIDAELGVLAMFSFRDPFYRETDDFFLQAFHRVHGVVFSQNIFLAARRRTLSRLQDKGSIDQCCEKQFDRWLAGYHAMYQVQLSHAVIEMTPELFMDKLTGYFDSSATSGFALVGKDNRC